ncbi:hypothetical protein PoB_004193400 [Plakobranchus ocellatus]|uniref:Uncharacterized protein n=1 Tax=Plakobranchus ocellatus TaxID=259542 RepID=A0AAV4B9Q4_9GAST|nr:hypothetical protein PoB_004193400 [Plakobranchus ocellatus]
MDEEKERMDWEGKSPQIVKKARNEGRFLSKKLPKTCNMSLTNMSDGCLESRNDRAQRKTSPVDGDGLSCELNVLHTQNQETTFSEDDSKGRGKKQESKKSLSFCKDVINDDPLARVRDTKGGVPYSYFSADPHMTAAVRTPSRIRTCSLVSNNSTDSSGGLTSCNSSSDSGSIVDLGSSTARDFEIPPWSNGSVISSAPMKETNTEVDQPLMSRLFLQHFRYSKNDINEESLPDETHPLLTHGRDDVEACLDPEALSVGRKILNGEKVDSESDDSSEGTPEAVVLRTLNQNTKPELAITIHSNDTAENITKSPAPLEGQVADNFNSVTNSTKAPSREINVNKEYFLYEKENQEPAAHSKSFVPPSLPDKSLSDSCPSRTPSDKSLEPNRPSCALQRALDHPNPPSRNTPNSSDTTSNMSTPLLQVFVPVPKKCPAKKNSSNMQKRNRENRENRSCTASKLCASENDTHVSIAPFQTSGSSTIHYLPSHGPEKDVLLNDMSRSPLNSFSPGLPPTHRASQPWQQVSSNSANLQDVCAHSVNVAPPYTQPHAFSVGLDSSGASQKPGIPEHSSTREASNTQLHWPNDPGGLKLNEHQLRPSDMASHTYYRHSHMMYEPTNLPYEIPSYPPMIPTMSNGCFMLPPTLQPNGHIAHFCMVPVDRRANQTPIAVDPATQQYSNAEKDFTHTNQQQFMNFWQPWGFPPFHPYHTNSYVPPWIHPMFYNEYPRQAQTTTTPPTAFSGQTQQHNTSCLSTTSSTASAQPAPFQPPFTSQHNRIVPNLSMPSSYEAPATGYDSTNCANNTPIKMPDYPDVRSSSSPKDPHKSVQIPLGQSIQNTTPQNIDCNKSNINSETLSHQGDDPTRNRLTTEPIPTQQRDVEERRDNDNLALTHDDVWDNCSGSSHSSRTPRLNDTQRNPGVGIEGFSNNHISHLNGQVPTMRGSLPSTTDSHLEEMNQHCPQRSPSEAQSQLHLLGHHCGYSLRDPPNYIILCTIACFFNAIFGIVALWLNHLAVKDFKRQRFASSSRKHLGAIVLSTASIFVTLTILLLLLPQMFTIAKDKDAFGSSYNETERCLNLLLGHDENFLKVYGMDFDTYCKVLENKKLTDNLVAHAIHYQNVKQELAKLKGDGRASSNDSLVPEVATVEPFYLVPEKETLTSTDPPDPPTNTSVTKGRGNDLSLILDPVTEDLGEYPETTNSQNSGNVSNLAEENTEVKKAVTGAKNVTAHNDQTPNGGEEVASQGKDLVNSNDVYVSPNLEKEYERYKDGKFILGPASGTNVTLGADEDKENQDS